MQIRLFIGHNCDRNFFFLSVQNDLLIDIPRVLSVPPPRISFQWTSLPPNRFFTILSRRMCFREKCASAKVVWNKILYKIHPQKSGLGLFVSLKIQNSDFHVFKLFVYVPMSICKLFALFPHQSEQKLSVQKQFAIWNCL